MAKSYYIYNIAKIIISSWLLDECGEIIVNEIRIIIGFYMKMGVRQKK